MYSRYDNRKIFLNKNKVYRFLMDERNVKQIRHFSTPKFRELTEDEINDLELVGHIWTTFDRFYKLAHKYYDDPTLWWVIARFNERPTEFHLEVGETIYIPFPLERVLSLYGD